MYISNNIKHLLFTRNIKSNKLASYLGVKPATVSAYINGITNPSSEVLIKLSDFFEISIDDLMKVDLSESEKTKNNVLNKQNGEVTEGVKKIGLMWGDDEFLFSLL